MAAREVFDQAPDHHPALTLHSHLYAPALSFARRSLSFLPATHRTFAENTSSGPFLLTRSHKSSIPVQVRQKHWERQRSSLLTLCLYLASFACSSGPSLLRDKRASSFLNAARSFSALACIGWQQNALHFVKSVGCAGFDVIKLQEVQRTTQKTPQLIECHVQPLESSSMQLQHKSFSFQITKLQGPRQEFITSKVAFSALTFASMRRATSSWRSLLLRSGDANRCGVTHLRGHTPVRVLPILLHVPFACLEDVDNMR